MKWITVKLPVYVGEVSDLSPDFIDRDEIDFLSVEERKAINRVHLGHAVAYGNPARLLAADGVAARALFAQIAASRERLLMGGVGVTFGASNIEASL